MSCGENPVLQHERDESSSVCDEADDDDEIRMVALLDRCRALEVSVVEFQAQTKQHGATTLPSYTFNDYATVITSDSNCKVSFRPFSN